MDTGVQDILEVYSSYNFFVHSHPSLIKGGVLDHYISLLLHHVNIIHLFLDAF